VVRESFVCLPWIR